MFGEDKYDSIDSCSRWRTRQMTEAKLLNEFFALCTLAY